MEFDGLVLLDGVLARRARAKRGAEQGCVLVASGVDTRVEAAFCVVSAAARAEGSPRSKAVIVCREGKVVAWPSGKDRLLNSVSCSDASCWV